MYKVFILSMLVLAACTENKKTSVSTSSTLDIKNIKGMEIYEANCAACHGSDGTGSIPGIPDLTQVAGFKRGRDSDSELFRHIKHVENGLKTPKSPLAMPAKGGNPNLTEQEIIEVLKYMREKFTNE